MMRNVEVIDLCLTAQNRTSSEFRQHLMSGKVSKFELVCHEDHTDDDDGYSLCYYTLQGSNEFYFCAPLVELGAKISISGGITFRGDDDGSFRTFMCENFVAVALRDRVIYTKTDDSLHTCLVSDGYDCDKFLSRSKLPHTWKSIPAKNTFQMYDTDVDEIIEPWLNNMDAIEPGLYHGNIESGTRNNVMEMGISTVINCAALEFTHKYDKDDKIQSLLLRWNDEISNAGGESIFDGQPNVVDAFNFITGALKRKEKVLVQCFQGKSRSSAVLIYYLIRTHKWGYDKALAYLKSKRLYAQPNASFEKQLRMYCDAEEL